MEKEYLKQRYMIAGFGTLLLWMIGICNVLLNEEIGAVSSGDVIEIRQETENQEKAGETEETEERERLYDLMLQEQVKEEVKLTYIGEVPMIKVLLKDSSFDEKKHETVKLTSEGSFSVCFTYKGQTTEIFYAAGDIVNMGEHKEWFEEGEVVVNGYGNSLKFLSLEREYGTPTYEGKLLVQKSGKQFYVINEVPLETYLRYVVPSEMPSGYPGEALKAQAICARTYAYRFIQNPGYPQLGAHVDDSVSYQVFNNIPPQKSTDEAIEETRGMLLCYKDRLAETFFYSTSCGFGTDVSVWNSNTEKYPYLQAMNHGETKYVGVTALSTATTGDIPTGEEMKEEGVFVEYISRIWETDFEADLPWYRWSYEVADLDEAELEKRLKSKYKSDPDLVLTQDAGGNFVSKEIGDIKQVKEMWVSSRRAGGAACSICIQTEDALYQVLTENAIRNILCDGETKVLNNESKKVSFPTMLPSAFFAISTSKDGQNVVGYKVIGGGYGHGIGMSQNGASQMARCGYSAIQILQHFFDGTQIIGAY